LEDERPEMGVPFRIVLYATNAAAARAASDAAYQRIAQLNDIMSDYEMDSELSKLSHSSGQGRDVPLSEDLWVVLQRAQQVSERSDGAFDVTVGPCVLLWRKARREHKLPNPARLAEARKSVGYRFVHLNPQKHSAELLAPDMHLDLGGIAKGYAMDAALKVLSTMGIKSALVSGGGDMAVSDPPPGKTGWRIELPPLDTTNAPPPRYVYIAHAGLSTSGDLFQRLEIDGKRYSHIVDPRTGIGLTDHSLVTVIAPDALTSDSLTKVVSVLGPGPGLKFIEETPGVVACVARKPADTLEVFESKNFNRYYQP
jgi:thiamine biosynthesis lipoprotein